MLQFLEWQRAEHPPLKISVKCEHQQIWYTQDQDHWRLEFLLFGHLKLTVLYGGHVLHIAYQHIAVVLGRCNWDRDHFWWPTYPYLRWLLPQPSLAEVTLNATDMRPYHLWYLKVDQRRPCHLQESNMECQKCTSCFLPPFLAVSKCKKSLFESMEHFRSELSCPWSLHWTQVAPPATPSASSDPILNQAKRMYRNILL